MRGEHCVAGASIISAIAVILLVFANIGQISPGTLTSNIYLAEINVAAFGAGYEGATGKSAGLYDTQASRKMGQHAGLKQYYRYGIYKSCGYQKNGDGVCNGTIFGYPMEPLGNLQADIGTAYVKQAGQIIDDPTAATFMDASYNVGLSRAGSLCIFVGSCLAALALIFGFIKSRFTFFFASACSGLSAILLMVGAAMWTALISKDNALHGVKVANKNNLGIFVTSGPTLYLVWVSFALMTLSVAPYVISMCTYRK